ncbi:MAG: hypothetical protein KDA24_19015 [Deltaproteobacteria bacterium]|nr:hypothetical protein [Deltaproteobacteria bacterium]
MLNRNLTLFAAALLSFGALTACPAEVCEYTEAPSFDEISAAPATVEAGGDIDLTFLVSNFDFSMESEDEHAHGDDDDDDHGDAVDLDGPCPIGHVHVYLDDLMTEPLGQPTTPTATVTIPADTPAGEHTLIGRLHGLDHTIFVTDDGEEVTAQTTITVEDPATVGR